MDRAAAVQRINDGLDWLPAGNQLEPKIIAALQEAQRYLERGISLPKFLLQRDQILTLTVGTTVSQLPDGFLRESDEAPLHYTPTGTAKPFYLRRVNDFRSGVEEALKDPNLPISPKTYYLRLRRPGLLGGAVGELGQALFFTTADKTYSLLWDYYKAAEVLTSNIENEWLRSAPEWLIGEAGIRMANDLGRPNSKTKFTEMMQKARDVWFREIVIEEEAAGPLIMGENN